MNNLEIRKKIKESRILHYEIAAQIGISEFTLCRWFRQELSGERKEKVMNAIEAIKASEAVF